MRNSEPAGIFHLTLGKINIQPENFTEYYLCVKEYSGFFLSRNMFQNQKIKEISELVTYLFVKSFKL